MNVQLLLLLICASTHASPTVVPTDLDYVATDSVAEVTLEATEASKELDVITGLSSAHPVTAEQRDAVDVTTQGPFAQVTLSTAELGVETETLPPVSTEAAEPLNTEPPAVESRPTEAPEDAEVIPHWTEAVKADTADEVVVEEGAEGLSSGQVVGIVIGALLAVVIVIAVVIAVVKRMGKYSFASNKKPVKKENPLKKKKTKAAKQQELSKFWKF
ncbi:podoplanin isoform 2-T2 [Syngnathus typhle]